jgi:hypothetical protein
MIQVLTKIDVAAGEKLSATPLRSPTRKDHWGFDLISDTLPFGKLWYAEPDAISNAVGYAKFFSRSHDAVIRVFDEAGTLIETHEHGRNLQEP